MINVDDRLIRETVRKAVLRDASERIARGESLMDGTWIPGPDLPERRRRAAFRAFGQFLEMAVLLALLALVGLGLLLLPSLLL